MDSSDINIITFGKYKGKSVHEMMNDHKYVHWCKLQPWFKTRYPAVYNIVVHQTLPKLDHDLTPEHNRLQNKFLEKSFQNSFLNYLSEPFLPDTFQDDICKIYTTDVYKKYCDGEQFCLNCEYRVEFEGPCNWDVIISRRVYGDCLTLTQVEEKYPREQTSIEINKEFKEKGIGNLIKVTGYNIGLRTNSNCKAYVELKPSLGDDYPIVLRKMKQQLKFTEGYPYSGQKYVLLIEQFDSFYTTREQLKIIFKQTGITVLFLNELPCL